MKAKDMKVTLINCDVQLVVLHVSEIKKKNLLVKFCSNFR